MKEFTFTKISNLFATAFTEKDFYKSFASRCNYKNAFYIYSLLIHTYNKAMDFLFTDYKEGITITIDETFEKNFQKLRRYMRVIEDRKDLHRYHGFIFSGNNMSLWDDHDFLNEDWKYRRKLFIAEYEEVSQKAGDRRLDDSNIYFENLVKEIDNDIKRHEYKKRIRDSITTTSGSYKLKYTKQVLSLMTPNGNILQLAKLQFGRSPDALLTYLFNNPTEEISIKTLEEDTKFQYKDIYKVLSSMSLEKNIRQTFFDISKGRIIFYPQIRVEELKEKGIKKEELDSEIMKKFHS